MRFPGMLPAIVALAVAAAPAASARSIVRTAEPVGPEANVLRADPGSTPAELIQAALRLPAAQLAMQQMAAAGFTRAPAADVARTSGGRVCVSIAYTDPVFPAHAPLVLVMSDPLGSPPRTWVMSEVFDVDLATGAVQLASGAPEGTECIVTIADMNSTRPDNYTVDTNSVRAKFVRWLTCSVLACGAGAAGCTTVGVLVGPLAPPAVAGCAVAVCAVGSFICLW